MPKLVKRKQKINSDYVPTGSTMANLCLSDTPFGGYARGTVVNPVGKKSTGKSFLILSGLADMLQYSDFDDYRLIYDDAEFANKFNLTKLFKGLRDRIETDTISDTIQDFYGNFLLAKAEGRPFIYVLDSFDSLTSKEDHKLANELRLAKQKGKELKKGTYGTDKTKWLKRFLNETKVGMEGNILIIISQVIQVMDRTKFEPKYTHTGGESFLHMSHHEYWLNRIQFISRNIRKQPIEIGQHIRFKVTKNKETGKHRIINFPIYYDYGIDDIRSIIDWLVDYKHWSKAGQTINAKEFKIKGTLNDLINHIEENNLIKPLQELVGSVWLEVEEEAELKRKPRF